MLEVNLPLLICFSLYLRAIFKVQVPGEAYIWKDDLTEGFLRYPFGWGGGVYLEGLIHGGAYFWNFTVFDFPLSSFNYLLKKNYVDTVRQENPYNFLYNLYYIVSVYWGLNGQYQN